MAKTKLSIYLIKDGITRETDILKDISKKVRIPNIGVFYTERSSAHVPDWKDGFFEDTLHEIDYLFHSNSKGILLAKIRHYGKTLTFALTFGTGRHNLKELVVEERFGLLVTLNSVDPESIRTIEKSTISANSKNSREQMSKPSRTSDFGIDIEQDLLKTVTGISRVPRFGKTVSGADGLSITVTDKVKTVGTLLKECYKRFKSTDYQKDFEWIDHMKGLRDSTIINSLNEKLLENLNNGNTDNIWVALPDVIDWANLEGLRFTPRGETLDDVDIPTLLDALGSEIDIHSLKRKTLYAISATTEAVVNSWSFYKCIYAEIEVRRKQYILNNGQWYEIATDFIDHINKEYESIPLSTLKLPDYNHRNEGEYNAHACSTNRDLFHMDRKNIAIGGGANRIEFCDLYSKRKKKIHVKQGGSSSVLSHLFMQGLNSGEAFAGDQLFRQRLNEKLIDGWKLPDPKQRINTSEYEIVFAIIDRHTGPRPKIPFFSKISLKNAKKRLESLLYTVSLKHIRSVS
jgi:uncharacterized protein (TIGR04141 family)